MRARYLAVPMGGCSPGTAAIVASRILLGGEADIAFPYFYEDGAIAPPLDTRSGTLADKVDMVSTVRARVGWTSGRWLLYTTVGASVSQSRLIDSVAATRAEDVLRRPVGPVFGAGAEVALAGGWKGRVRVSLRPTGSRRRPPGGSERRVTGVTALPPYRCERRVRPVPAPSRASRDRCDCACSLEPPRASDGRRAGLPSIPIALRRHK